MSSGTIRLFFFYVPLFFVSPPFFLTEFSLLGDRRSLALFSVCLCLAGMLVFSNAALASVYEVLVLVTSFIFILHLAGIVIE